MTPRQKQLLQAIVEYYVHTASPVGSLGLSRKFVYSPATIRAEMAELERLGYIMHPHTSAGRIPTDMGYRLYVDHLKHQIATSEQKINRVEQAIEHRLKAAGEPTQIVRSAVDSLVETTNNLGLGLVGGAVYMSGLTNLFKQPEFAHPSKVYEVAYLLDNLVPWLQETAPVNKVNIYIGKESPIGQTSGCSIIVSRFASPTSDYSYIGIVGPTRQSYERVIRLVEHAGQQLEEVLNG